MSRPDRPLLPHGRTGRALAVGLLAFAVSIFVLFLILPAFNLWHTLSDELPLLRAQADGYERLIARQGAIDKELRELRAELATTPDYIETADLAIAAAQVQRDLGVRAESSGVAVRTTLTLSPTAVDDFTLVGFQLSVSGSLRSLRNFLYAIETGQPRLVVDRLLLRQSQASSQDAQVLLYDMTLDLHGYMQGTNAP